MNTALATDFPYEIVGNFVYFKFVSIEPITEAAALAFQTKQGYHPMGYNFYKFKCVHKVEPTNGMDYFEATWSCGASCD